MPARCRLDYGIPPDYFGERVVTALDRVSKIIIVTWVSPSPLSPLLRRWRRAQRRCSLIYRADTVDACSFKPRRADGLDACADWKFPPSIPLWVTENNASILPEHRDGRSLDFNVGYIASAVWLWFSLHRAFSTARSEAGRCMAANISGTDQYACHHGWSRPLVAFIAFARGKMARRLPLWTAVVPLPNPCSLRGKTKRATPNFAWIFGHGQRFGGDFCLTA